MACYAPLRAAVVVAPGGARRLVFKGGEGQGVSLPCGRCIGCRLERARQWAVRIVHESKMHRENCFVTLTYDPAHLPADGSLNVEHCQLFLKRLRRRLEPARIRFFLAGEYGEKLERPHYHAVVFGWSPSDGVFYKKSGEFDLFTSALLSQVWGLGFASYGAVSFDSAAYVANYATKKVVGDKEVVDAHYRGRKPEFLCMSRGGRSGGGGIGGAWLARFFSDVFPADEVITRGFPSRPPRFYDQELLKRNPFEWYALKARRADAAARLEDMILQSGARVSVAPANNARRLQVREAVARAKLSLKRRSLESA